ncbi:MAG: LuxR C-terminal-related transcriptional regulator [Cyanobacteria bacterium]|nr:LuxR C-terminal-related transcriptional regulator [Cyanobacteriota bacterium]
MLVVATPPHLLLDTTRLLFNLQYVNQISQDIAGCLDPRAIAQQVTTALVEQLGCILARLWLVEPNQTQLRLVASQGLYTHLDGEFALVPMGAYKVGKIAQNRVSFLSNRLADEPWVKDRDWAIANGIQGFAGYPLATSQRVVGVLATFSQAPLAPEFLEVLQILCMTTTVALEGAIQAQRPVPKAPTLDATPLSEQLAALLAPSRLILMGTEQPLAPPVIYAFLQAAEILNQVQCNYCRLVYGEQSVSLEAIAAIPPTDKSHLPTDLAHQFRALQFMATGWGGQLETPMEADATVVKLLLTMPYHTTLKNPLSEREREVMTLLAQGRRDRDIAHTLFISESTVKFHINNSLSKLQAKNRYQGVYQAAIHGCI